MKNRLGAQLLSAIALVWLVWPIRAIERCQGTPKFCHEAPTSWHCGELGGCYRAFGQCKSIHDDGLASRCDLYWNDRAQCLVQGCTWKDANIGLIILNIILALCFVAGVCVAICWYCRRMRQRQEQANKGAGAASTNRSTVEPPIAPLPQEQEDVEKTAQ